MAKSIMEEADEIRSMPDEYLTQQLNAPPGQGIANRFLAAVEMSRRNRMRRRAIATAGDSVDRRPVISQLQQEAAQLRGPAGFAGGGLVGPPPSLTAAQRREEERLRRLSDLASGRGRVFGPVLDIAPSDATRDRYSAEVDAYNAWRKAREGLSAAFPEGPPYGDSSWIPTREEIASSPRAHAFQRAMTRLADPLGSWSDPSDPYGLSRDEPSKRSAREGFRKAMGMYPEAVDEKTLDPGVEEYGALDDPSIFLPPPGPVGDTLTLGDEADKKSSKKDDTGLPDDFDQYTQTPTAQSILAQMGLGDADPDNDRTARMGKAVALGMMAKAFADNPTFVGGFGNAAAAGAGAMAQTNQQLYKDKLARRQAILEEAGVRLTEEQIAQRDRQFNKEYLLRIKELNASIEATNARIDQTLAVSRRAAVEMAHEALINPEGPYANELYKLSGDAFSKRYQELIDQLASRYMRAIEGRIADQPIDPNVPLDLNRLGVRRDVR